MPTINLDELLPEDTTFELDGESYVLAGDLPVELALRFQDALREGAEAELSGDISRVRETTGVLEEIVLDAFRVRLPDLDELPFGGHALEHILLQLVAQLGLAGVNVAVDDPPPDRPAPKPRTRRPRAAAGSK